MVPDLPSDTTWAAAILLDASGGVIAATGLVPITSGKAARIELPPVEAGDNVRHAILSAWSDAALAALGPLPLDRLSEPIGLAGPLDPLLPAGFSAEGDGVQEFQLSPTAARELTAPWLPRCPSFPASMVASLSCSPGSCTITVNRADCHLSIETGDCLFGEPDGFIDGRGKLHLSPGTRLGECTNIETRPPALLTAHCLPPDGEACTMDLFPRVDELPYDVETVALTDQPYLPHTTYPQPPDTYTPSLVLRDGKAFASVWNGHSRGANCGDTAGHLSIVDLASLTVTASVPLPRCTGFLTADPAGPGLIAIFRDPSWSAAHLDASGRLLDRSVLPFVDADRNVTFAASDVSGGRLAITLGEKHDLDARVHFLDPRSFAVVQTATLATYSVGDVRWIDGLLWYLDGGYDRLVPVDPETGIATEGFSVHGNLASRGLQLMSMAYLPTSGLFLAMATGRLGGVTVNRREMSIGFARLYQTVSHCDVAVEEAAHPTQALVGITDVEAPYDARLARLDPSTGRFLPGTVRVGRGPIDRLYSTPDGRIFGTLSWEGKLFRATPRP